MRHFKIATCTFLFLLVSILTITKAEGETMNVVNGKTIALDYTLTVEGQVVDTSEGGQPIEYTHGEGSIIPGLERKLEGMSVGEEKKVQISPEEGYGELNPDAFREVPREHLPTDVEIEEGMMFQMQTPAGEAMPVTVSEIKPENVVLDLNHPLAGKTLEFDVKIVSVE